MLTVSDMVRLMSMAARRDRSTVDQGSTWTGVRGFLQTVFEVARFRAVVVFGLMLLRSVTSSFGLLMLVPMLGVVGLEVDQGSIGYVTGFIERMFEAVGIQPNLISVLIVYVLTMAANAALVWWQSVMGKTMEQTVVTELRKRLYKAIATSTWLHFSRQRHSDYSHVLTVEIERVGGALSVFLGLAVKVILAVVYVGLALVLSPVMTGIVATAGLALSLALRRQTLLGKQKGEEISRAYGQLYASVGEHLAGMKISKSLGLEGRQAAFFGSHADRTADAQIDRVRNNAALGFWFEVGSVLILASMLYVALEVLALQLASILLLIFLFARLIPMLTGIQKGFQSLLNLLPAYAHVVMVLDRSREAVESIRQIQQALELERTIELADVSFTYSGAPDERVVRNLHMTIEAGKTTAIVGPSGAGKTTVTDIVIGLLAPTSGRVEIDGRTLAADRLAAWRDEIGYVPQDVFLFHDTIRANLEMVAPDAGEDALWGALEDAAAAEFVRELPEGLDTVVGDRGVRLSGGERQRISLARALLRRPSLLVLDEATSALDVENERRIQDAIERLHGKVTILVVAHRLSTIRNADVIYVLEDGVVVESGDWESLAQKPGGRFRELCRAQGLTWDVSPRSVPSS